MARRKKEPWEIELEKQLWTGGGDVTQPSSTTGVSGGISIPRLGGGDTKRKNPTPQPTSGGIKPQNQETNSPTPPAEKDTAEAPVAPQATTSEHEVATPPQPQAESKPASGNSSGHLSTVKTNYSKGSEAAGKASASAGYGNSHGRAENVRTTATKAAASGSYQNRDSSLSQEQREGKATLERERGEKLSNTYNSDGERMTRSEFKAYQVELKEMDIQGMRRIVISPDPALGVSEKEMVSITRDAMWAWQEDSGKQFDFSFAVHDGQSVIHSHVMMYSERANDVNMAAKQLETFKSIVDEAIEAQLDQREELGQDIAEEQSITTQGEELKNDENQTSQLDGSSTSDTEEEDAAIAAEEEELAIAL